MALIPFKAIGSIGINKDLSAHELPMSAWTDAQNIRFLDGYAYQFMGYGEAFASPSAEPQHVLPCNVSNNRYWVYATPTKQFCVTSTGGTTTHTDITHITARTGIANNWTSTLLSGVPILNAGDTLTPPMAWNLNTASKFVDLTAWPATTYCKSIRAYKNFLISMNITKGSTNYPYMVKWSHPADPGSLPASWDQTDATKQAGEYDIAEGADPIIDGFQLRDSFMVYKESSIWRMDFIGGNYIFKFTKVLGKSGAMNRNCIADIDGYHIVLTTNDVIIHDGNTSDSILDKKTRRWLFQNIDVANNSKAFVFANPFFNEVFICYPAIGSSTCDKAIVYNYKDKTVSTLNLPNINHAAYGPVDNSLVDSWATKNLPWSAITSSWNGSDFVPSNARVILGSSNIKLYLLDASASFDGALPSAYLERKGLSLDAPETMKLVKGVRPVITGNIGETVQIQVGSSNDPFTDPTWIATMTHTIGSTIANDCLVSGRYLAIRFSTGSAYSWRLDSFELDVVQQGGW